MRRRSERGRRRRRRRGAPLAAALAAHTHLRGTVFDLPSARSEALATVAAVGVGDRAAFAGGSVFEAVPAGADVYVLAQVLHDGGDRDAEAIVRTVRRATPPGGRLVVLELVRSAADDDPLMDLEMLVLVGGRERGEGEWRALLAADGFAVERISPGAPAAIVARPAPPRPGTGRGRSAPR